MTKKFTIFLILLLQMFLINTSIVPDTAYASGNKQIIVYYFHGSFRCQSCISMEQFTKEALDTYFSKQQKEGIIIFKVLNRDDEVNVHFEKDFDLTYNSVVIVKMDDTKIEKWNRLDKCWDYLKSKKEFMKFIKENIDRELN